MLIEYLYYPFVIPFPILILQINFPHSHMCTSKNIYLATMPATLPPFFVELGLNIQPIDYQVELSGYVCLLSPTSETPYHLAGILYLLIQ